MNVENVKVQLISKKRLSYFDVAKGIAILLMIAGHSGIPTAAVRFIHSFHVPLFFIVTGYFTSIKPFKEILKKGWIQLLRPYVFTIVLVIFFFVLMQFSGNLLLHKPYCLQTFKDLTMGLVTGDGVGPLWFLVALFWAKVFLGIILKFEKYTPALVVLGSTAAYLLLVNGIRIPWYVLPGMEASIFLYVGILLRRSNIFSYSTSLINILAISVVIYFSASSAFLSFEKSFPLLMLNVVTATVISIVVIENCQILERYKTKCFITNHLFGALNYIGRNTLIILCFHAVDMYINFWKYLHIKEFYLFLTLRLVITCMIPLVIKYIPIFNVVYLKKRS